MDDARAWEFRNTRGNTNVSLSQNSRMETNREYVSDVDTDIDSDADYKARKRASRTWKCRFAMADVPPALVRKPRSDITRSNIDNDENPGKGEHEEWISKKLHSPWICTDHQHGWENSDRQRCDIMDIAE